MKDLYPILGISKQADHQARHRYNRQQQDHDDLLRQIRDYRQEQPRIGLRKLYHILQPENIGRDRFIAMAAEAGLALRPVRCRRRTTRPASHRHVHNLIAGHTLNNVNQVWVSDITYYRVADTFYYLTLLMDLYSRFIVGAGVASSLHAHWSVAVLTTALAARAIPVLPAGKLPPRPEDLPLGNRLIHHSDRGSQYLSDAYVNLLHRANAAISTCSSVYDNAHSERLNGIIKQEYLDCWAISTPHALRRGLTKAVHLYNHHRPHTSLGMRTPHAFEAYLATTPIDEHPRMTIAQEQPSERHTAIG